MRTFFRKRSVQLVLVLVGSIISVSGQAPPARKEAPNPFVGTWVINLEKSRYNGAQEKLTSVRTIDVHANGVFIETHRNTRMVNGRTWEGFYHWVGNIEGREFPEFGRTGGPEPGNRLTIIPANPHLWNVTFRNRNGRVVLTDTWTVSPDRKTLTIDRKGTPANGPATHTIEVYQNEGFAMPGGTD
jgi:hypothetical protein